jgi:hypothetical protein
LCLRERWQDKHQKNAAKKQYPEAQLGSFFRFDHIFAPDK